MDSVDVSVTAAVEGWLDIAIAAIDQRLGDGYAAANPVLVAGYVQACAISALRMGLVDEHVSALGDIGTAVAAVAHAVGNR